ncbi:MAG: galactoside ABC transporter permease [Treponemataceae bacterium]|nr:galactoside ABC transporter permease [Treponemataceae bacterium]
MDINTLKQEIEQLKVVKQQEIAKGAKINSFNEDELLLKYNDLLLEYRKDGVHKIEELNQLIVATKKNRMLESSEKAKLIEGYKADIEKAKAVAAANKAEDAKYSKEAVEYSNALYKVYSKQVNKEENEKLVEIKNKYKNDYASISNSFRKLMENVSSPEEKEIKNTEYKSALFDAKKEFTSSVDKCKDNKNQVSIDHVQMNRNLRNGKTKFSEDFAMGVRDYINKFKLSKFLLDNGLYLAIAVFFIVCIIVAPIAGHGTLFSLPNILTILEQSSTRMFYALGVAGLILLAGTDLSICRMVALGAVVTGLILHPGMNIVTFFGMGPWDFTAIPMIVRLLMALSLSVILCVAFSCFAGVFTAKLKIHPFISTLASQLIIYGLLFFGTSGTPVGSIDSSIKDLIGGRWVLGVINGQLITFPKLIIPAVIAIIVAWFIWNKTTFGKNMYAVGGNSEAAAVSGISVFKVTMGVFIMAGIFYGCGAFLEAFKANASAGTGQGYELDAIAACVVGGISFNGGIGKIGGAVIGVIIFTSLTYCLTFLGIDTNLQFVFKGFIIIAAVALDSVKYLKRK